MLKKKSIAIILSVLILIGIIIFFMFFHTNTAKNLKIGNNTSSQEIVDYILNISSYEAIVKVEVESNKNKNQYILKQKYESPDKSEQEILEPSNVAGVKMSRMGNQLKIENTKLSLSTIFENYQHVSDNSLDLYYFIENYKSDQKATWKEENDQIVMKTRQEKEEKTLWIDKSNGKPIKLEIKGTNKNYTVYILYNEVNILK